MQFCIRKTCGTEMQGCEIKVHQFCVKSKVQTLKTESGVDFKSDSGSLDLYLQHIFKNQLRCAIVLLHSPCFIRFYHSLLILGTSHCVSTIYDGFYLAYPVFHTASNKNRDGSPGMRLTLQNLYNSALFCSLMHGCIKGTEYVRSTNCGALQ